MAELLYGPKRFAQAIDCDVRTAKAILNVIADVEIAPNVKRLSEEGYRKWLKERKAGGKVQAETGHLGRAQDHKWEPEVVLRQVGGGGG